LEHAGLIPRSGDKSNSPSRGGAPHNLGSRQSDLSFQNQFVSATRRAKHLGEEAEEWLFSDDCRWVFSFLAICAALDLSPQYIRQGLKRWRELGPQPRQQPAYLLTVQHQRVA